MCDDREQSPLTGRRHVLRGIGAGLILGSPLGRTISSLPQTRRRGATAPWREEPAQMGAFHLHGSHSEGTASIGAHIAELDRVGYDVAFMSDHDWRKRAFGAVRVLDFPGPTISRNGREVLTWERIDAGSPDSANAQYVPATGTRIPPGITSVLRTSVSARAGTDANVLHFADTTASRNANRVNLTGQTLTVEFNATTIQPDSWILVRLALSYHAASGGRGPDYYVMDYRLGQDAGNGRISDAHGYSGHAIAAQGWQQVTLNPTSDIADIWPDLDASDNSLNGLSIGVEGTNGSQAAADLGRITHAYTANEGQAPTDVIRQTISRQLSARSSDLDMHVAEEISQGGLHMNQFGANLIVPAYPPGIEEATRQEASREDMRRIIDEQVHAAGNLASLNHVYGTQEGSLLPRSAQRRATEDVARQLIADDLYAADIVEFGYQKRGNADLNEHLHLMEIILRNGYIVTANGVSDDHGARADSIDRINNPMATHVWAPSTGMDDVLAATAEGRAFVSNIARFDGQIDVQIDEFLTGSVVIDDRSTRARRKRVQVHGAGLRQGVIEVVHGPVDQPTAGASPTIEPGSTVVARFDTDTVMAGAASVVIDVTTSCYVYLRAVTTTQRGEMFLSAFTNPIWWLTALPDPSLRRLPLGRSVTRQS